MVAMLVLKRFVSVEIQKLSAGNGNSLIPSSAGTSHFSALGILTVELLHLTSLYALILMYSFKLQPVPAYRLV